MINWKVVIYEETKSGDGSLQLENLAEEIYSDYESLVERLKVLINKGYRFEVTAIERKVFVPEERIEEVQEFISEEWSKHSSKAVSEGGINRKPMSLKADANNLLEMILAMKNGEAINGMFWSQKIAEFLDR